VAHLDELMQAGRLQLTARDLAQLDHATVAEEVRIVPDNARHRLEPGELVLN
jgi:hypothetical protein